METKPKLKPDPDSCETLPAFSDDPTPETKPDLGKKRYAAELQKGDDPRVGTGWADHHQTKFDKKPVVVPTELRDGFLKKLFTTPVDDIPAKKTRTGMQKAPYVCVGNKGGKR